MATKKARQIEKAASETKVSISYFRQLIEDGQTQIPFLIATKDLKTIKKAASETGASISYFKQLIREGKLTKYKINSATYISLVEFESIAQPQPVMKIKGNNKAR